METLAISGRLISTHAPAGGATVAGRLQIRNWEISTHAPAGGATGDHAWRTAQNRFLLTPLREGRRKGGFVDAQDKRISTHAPAGGATREAQSTAQAAQFLLTPLREGRPRCSFFLFGPKRFLLTPLREGRPFVRIHGRPSQSISTHAPAGGATQHLTAGGLSPGQFLLTPLREGRQQFSTSPS